ncbi:MAG: lamin tail domain-containing protein [Planctomycetota bacterium]
MSGCGDKQPKANGTTTAPVTSNNNNNNSAASASQVAPPATTANPGPDLVAFVLRIDAVTAVEFQGVTITASGTLDESVDIGEVKLVGDDNSNGAYDAGEPDMAVVATPAFATDNGTVALAPATPVTIAAGASLQMLVVAEVTGGNGQTVQFDIAADTDVAIVDANGAVIPGGTFPIPGSPITIGTALPPAADHVLFTEVVWNTGTSTANPGDFIEIHNPTAAAVDLSTYYITDANQSTVSGSYADLPGFPGNGSKLGLANDLFDFVIQFPPGSSIASGATVTIAVDGAGFATTYGMDADYCIWGAAGTTVQMLNFQYATDNFTQAPPAGASVWHWPGEKLALFTWDGASDLVQDVDIVQCQGLITGAATDKTGISVDGPDANATPTAYQADTAEAAQALIPLAGGLITQRVDMLETGEVKTGGNGISGNDETSEPLDQTWATATVPTPGQP